MYIWLGPLTIQTKKTRLLVSKNHVIHFKNKIMLFKLKQPLKQLQGQWSDFRICLVSYIDNE